MSRAVKTKKVARVLLATERAAVERLAHEGVIEANEAEALLVENSVSLKKLSSHPPAIAVPSKAERIKRHALFRGLPTAAAEALAAICLEYYYDPGETTTTLVVVRRRSRRRKGCQLKSRGCKGPAGSWLEAWGPGFKVLGKGPSSCHPPPSSLRALLP